MPLDFNEIRELLKTIGQTDIAEVTLKIGDFELTVRKGVNLSNQTLSGEAGLSIVGSGTPISSPVPQVVSPARETPTNQSLDNHATASSVPPAVTQPTAIDQKLVPIPSPMVGTFYSAPAPGEPPFVEVGDRVKKGQTVCIIEAMKLMNEIEAEVSGQVMEILAQNGEPVEYGQPLMRINPD
ncbi:acetyl-CoA carboxylase biotin carboxyl carrier protein [Aetokthonos hydrillicola Thurmond2011]|uniref:Biotin carboxyl carrier protein of acetyl-CoA carboxylase n=1 Tax=Aetokthonos hydrillicola Thurmond2011 TaxID=2712845 RepID=A0AAP5IG79_9CYAN|nr:acetyl-CoA carboxylase biotin carboxyl carrier protein [Aetokthonos hydrillicola]MBO3457196.1 acetyl-CoA carboxylase biotin carboxyl carrier protein [Aetokthonos hydrillicola CCALA 1050]MBW4587547.1 acetyl-CoA carboxylase biotin carboxyl carrier protein [Aetokthonos hydrillicola CCALA 1050]MDR9900187.1 acetyl-CoA carboxylase biotin carboxyl carrier protein [Aetokthonos hydrillicola Thurmond2011]